MNNAMGMEDKLLEKGEAFFSQGSHELAVQMFLEVLDLNPSRKEAFNNLGCLYFQTGDLEKAEEFFLKAYSLDSDYLNALCNLSEFYKQKGNYPRELFFRKEALEVEQDNPAHWNALALCWLELGNIPEVENAFSRSLAIDDGQQQVRLLLEQLASIKSEASQSSQRVA